MINQPKLNAPGGESYTQSDLESKSGPELVALYNVIASNIGENAVRKFKDLATGKKRTWAMLEKYDAWLNSEDEQEAEVEAEEAFDPDFDEPAEKIAPKKARKSGVGAFIKDKLINTNESASAIIEAVKIHFPDSKATTRDVAWYKCKLTGEEKQNAQQPREK